MEILMTGGTGFVGTAMLENHRPDARIYVLTRQEITATDSRIKFVKYIPNIKFDCFVHLEPCDVVKTMEYAKSAGGARFLYASSGAAIKHENEYGKMKHASEIAISLDRRDAIIARLYSFIGPHLPPGYAASDFILDSLSGGPITIRGDGTPRRTYLYEEDLAEQMWALALGGSPGRIYNVGSTEVVTIRDFAKMVSDEFGGIEVVTLGGSEIGLGGQDYIPGQTCFPQRVSLRNAIRRTKERYETV